MVIKKSEYQNQYKSSVVQKHQSIYLENLNLRHQRRDREFTHTPICWDELSEEDDLVKSDSNEEGEQKSGKTKLHKKSEEKYQSLAEILSEAKERAEAAKKQQAENTNKVVLNSQPLANKNDDDEGILTSSSKVSLEDNKHSHHLEKKHVIDKSYSIYDIVDEDNKNMNDKLAKTYVLNPERILQEDAADGTDTDKDIQAADKVSGEKSKTLESNLRKKIYTKKRNVESQGPRLKKPSSIKSKNQLRADSAASSERPNSSPHFQNSSNSEAFVPPLSYVPRVRRPDRQACIPKAKCISATLESPIKERPPFVAYGAGDREDSLAVHRTHNVRALADVYLPALRAKSRREEQQKRNKEIEQRAHSAEAILNKLTSVTPRDPCDWESEYRKQYHGYEPKDYERATSARAVIPRASPIHAVHRGGCLVVHVD